MPIERVTAEDEIKTISKILADYRVWSPGSGSINNYNIGYQILERMSDPKYKSIFDEEMKDLEEKLECEKAGIFWHLSA